MEQKNPDSLRMLPDERRTTGVVALVAVIRMFGLFALLPVLSPYASGLDGATPILIGLAVGAYGLTAAFLQIPLGALSDRIGRLPVIIGGLAVFTIGSAVAGVSDSIYGVVLGRFLQGAGAITATLSALITDATRETVRTRAMAVFGAGIGISFMVALVAGPLIAAQFGVPAVFLTGAVLAAVAILLLRLVPDTPQPKVSPDWSIAPAFRADLLRVDLYVFLLHAIMTATFVALPFLLSERLALPLDQYWKMYVGALAISLAIGGPMVMKDHHQGRTDLISLAVGMILASRLSARLGHAGTGDADRVENLVAALGLPTGPPRVPADQLLELMRMDKKVLAGKLRLVLLDGAGSSFVADDCTEQEVLRILRDAAPA